MWTLLWVLSGFLCFSVSRVLQVSVWNSSVYRKQKHVCDVTPAVVIGFVICCLIGPLSVVILLATIIVWLTETVKWDRVLFNFCNSKDEK